MDFLRNLQYSVFDIRLLKFLYLIRLADLYLKPEALKAKNQTQNNQTASGAGLYETTENLVPLQQS
jgi:hypothetical protein